MHLPSQKTAVALLVLHGLGTAAYAADFVTFRASLGVSAYDNFFQQASNAQSEQVTTALVGVHVAVPTGRQQFDLDASLEDHQNTNYHSFGFQAQNYQLGWGWDLGSQWHTHITSQQAETLNEPSISATATQRNKNTRQSHSASLNYDLSRQVQIGLGITSGQSVNEIPTLGETSSSSHGWSSTLRYAPNPELNVTLSWQQGQGSATTDYNYTTVGVQTAWLPSPDLSFNALLQQKSQRYPQVSQNDFDGNAGQIGVAWHATGKTTLNASWKRDLTGYQAAGVSNSQNDVTSMAAVWDITAKSTVSLSNSVAVRTDQGQSATNRQDTTTSWGLSYSWKPSKNAVLSISQTAIQRTSNVANAGFSAGITALTGQMSF